MNEFNKEVIIIGGGPAGLAASIEIAKSGCKVLVVDENKKAGGQLFKQIHKFFGSKEHSAGIRGIDIGKQLLSETKKLGVEVWLDSEVIDLTKDKGVSIKHNGKLEILNAKSVLVATGASENAVNFEGWTLPGVMGAGAAQTMINVNRVLPGNRILMVGSGNVGVIVTYQLIQAGAEVVGIVEALPRIGAYGVHAAKVRRAGVPFFLKHTIIRAEGKDKVERAVICEIDDKFNKIPGTEKVLEVDVISVATGLRPLTEASWMAGVSHKYIPELGGWMPIHDENMQTSIPGIYIAGDTAGVEEANTAMDEGRLAGLSIAENLGYFSKDEAKIKKDEIKARLIALRQGPFGEKRLNAKSRIIKEGF